MLIHSTKSNVRNSPSLGLDWLLSSKLLPGLGTQQNPGLHHIVYLSNEIWAVGTVSNALLRTPHPSAENNQSWKIKVLGKAEIGCMPRMNKRFKGRTTVILLIWNWRLGRDLVIYHWSKTRICHVEARVASCYWQVTKGCSQMGNRTV